MCSNWSPLQSRSPRSPRDRDPTRRHRGPARRGARHLVGEGQEATHLGSVVDRRGDFRGSRRPAGEQTSPKANGQRAYGVRRHGGSQHLRSFEYSKLIEFRQQKNHQLGLETTAIASR